MSNKIIVPTLGESITEATVSKWLKNQGDPVSSDEPIVELETDKVNVEVPSPSSGTLEKIIIKEGDTVKVGALLGSVSVSKKISSSLKEEKVYDPPIKKNIETNKKIPKIKENQPHKLVEQDHDEKKIFNDEPLILEKETESKIDKPLILDKLHIEEKIEKKAAAQDVQKIKRISPAARKSEIWDTLIYFVVPPSSSNSLSVPATDIDVPSVPLSIWIAPPATLSAVVIVAR